MFVITGTPGTGKHTLTSMLAGSLAIPVVDINQVAFRHNLVEPTGVDTARLLSVMPEVDGPGIVVGHLATYVVEPSSVERVVVLRRSPYELEGVYRERGYSPDKAMENLGAEILGVIYSEALNTFGSVTQMDVTGRGEQQSVAFLTEALYGAYPSDEVDWLGQVADNDDMARFFK